MFAPKVGATESVIPKSKHETRSNIVSGVLTALSSGGLLSNSYLANKSSEFWKKKAGLSSNYIVRLHAKEQNNEHLKIRNKSATVGVTCLLMAAIRRLFPGRCLNALGVGAVTSNVVGTAVSADYPLLNYASENIQKVQRCIGTSTIICSASATVSEAIHTGFEQYRLYKDNKNNSFDVQERANEKTSKKELLINKNIDLKQEEKNKISS